MRDLSKDFAATATGPRAFILYRCLTVPAVLHRSSTTVLVAFPPRQRIPGTI
jgi:hypothetical protein